MNAHHDHHHGHGGETADETTLDWSLRLADIPPAGLAGTRQADAAELARLTRLVDGAERIEVKSLACEYELTPRAIEGYPGLPGVSGSFHVVARLRQVCVVTLEPIDTTVDERFEQDFVEGCGEAPAPAPAEVDHEDPFATEPPVDMPHGRIGFGPLVYEYFAMGIDPNPRKPGVEFDETAEAGSGAAAVPPSPFAVLKKLKKRE
jgi:hypothetical protein